MLLHDIGDPPNSYSTGISDLLARAEISKPRRPRDKTKNRREQLQEVMEDRGLDLEKVVDSLKAALDDEKTQLPAARLVLEAMNLLSDKDKQAPAQINITINDPGGQSNLLELVMPTIVEVNGDEV